MLKTKPGKLYRCTAPGCQERHERRQAFVKWCSPECGATLAQAKLAKKRTQEANTERQADKAKLDGMKPLGHWVKLTQDAWNKARRLECLAAGDGCISCGRSQQEVQSTDGWKPGGAWDCGHFMSVGAYPNLRFEADNAFLQCKSCNAGSGKYTRKAQTVADAYLENLIAKIGQDRIDQLKADQTPRKYTREDLEKIRADARKRIKSLETS